MSILSFENFEVDIRQRRLFRDGHELRIGSRAFDILATLVERSGELLTKEELVASVWRDTFVGEGSLRVHMVALRRALGGTEKTNFIENVAGRGYAFLAPVKRSDTVVNLASPVLPAERNTPWPLEKLIGRESFIESCLSNPGDRLTSIVGAGGIGKTAVAVQIAHMLENTAEAVYFLDLAALSDRKLLPSTLASILGLSVYTDDPMPGVLRALGRKKVVFVFDNCEHVVDAAAKVAEVIVNATPYVSVLATSREPLGSQGERIRHIPPLSVPSEDHHIRDVGEFSALELFAERVTLSIDEPILQDEETLSLAGQVVRRLDGIPLAIEFAASRVADLGLKNLAASLDQPLRTLRRGRRTAPARQQTLRATLDWSFQGLTKVEKSLISSLSVFAGSFSIEAAAELATTIMSTENFDDALDGLVLKSLLSVTKGGASFRLLETTREYAGEKLAGGAERRTVVAAHAAYCMRKLRQAEKDWGATKTADWLAIYGSLIHDLRLALNWALSDDGDTALGVELSTTSYLLWSHLGLMKEQLAVAERALDAVDSGCHVDPLIEGQLRAAYASTLYNVKSTFSDHQAFEQFTKAVEIAKAASDCPGLFRSSGGVSAVYTIQGDYEAAIETMKRFDERCGPLMVNGVSRTMAHNLHYLGDHREMRTQAKLAYEREAGRARRMTHGTSFDFNISANCVLSRTTWLEGQADEAIAMIRETVKDAHSLDHAISSCLLLASAACPVMFFTGHMTEGLEYLARLRDVATENSLLRWLEWADGFDKVLAGTKEQTTLPTTIFEKLNGPLLENLLVLSGTRAPVGEIERALQTNAGWCRPELYRLLGLAKVPTDPLAARELIIRGFDLAVRQEAKIWQLRCAVSLFGDGEGDSNEDAVRLSGVLDAVSQGMSTPDVLIAVELLERRLPAQA